MSVSQHLVGCVSVVSVSCRLRDHDSVTAKVLSTEVHYVSASGQHVETTLGEVDGSRLSRALPVRRPRSHAGARHYSGLFWSATTQGHVPFESRLELDRLWLADFDPDVTWIAAQPMWLVGIDGDAVRRHAPDLLLSQRDEVILVDVKPAKFAALPEVAAVFDWTSRLCRARGWTYQVWTGEPPEVLANIRSVSMVRRFSAEDLVGSVEHLRMLEVWSGRREVDLSLPLEHRLLAAPGAQR